MHEPGRAARLTAESFWTPLSSEWYATQSNEQGINYRWAQGNQGNLLVYPCGSDQVVLHFSAFGFAQPRTIEVLHDGHLLRTFELPQETVVLIEIPLTLSAGENRITLRTVEAATSPLARGFANDERLLSFNLSAVTVRPR